MVAYAAAADVVRCCCSMEEVWAAEKNFNLCVERIFEGCKKVPWLNGLFNIHTSSYEDFLVCSSGT